MMSVLHRFSAAALQQHIQCILETAAQICGAARGKQRAQFEGGGRSLLVDVRQQVFLLLRAQDELGVVVVEVHLVGDEHNNLCYSRTAVKRSHRIQDVITARLVTFFFPQCCIVHSFSSALVQQSLITQRSLWACRTRDRSFYMRNELRRSMSYTFAISHVGIK